MCSLNILQHADIFRMGFFKRPLAKYPRLLMRRFVPQEKKNNRNDEKKMGGFNKLSGIITFTSNGSI